MQTPTNEIQLRRRPFRQRFTNCYRTLRGCNLGVLASARWSLSIALTNERASIRKRLRALWARPASIVGIVSGFAWACVWGALCAFWRLLGSRDAALIGIGVWSTVALREIRAGEVPFLLIACVAALGLSAWGRK